MKNKKLTRTWIGCRKKKEKDDLIRIVKNSEGKIMVDLNGKMAGRGAYICKDEECFNRAVKSNKLKIALKTNVEDKVYEKLRGVIFDRGWKNFRITWIVRKVSEI